MLAELATAIQMSIRQNYNLAIKSATPIGTGAMSTTMRLATNRETLFLKIYKSARNQKTPAQPDPQRIAFTHAVQDFLHQEGFPIPRLLPNNGGETFSVCDNPLETGEVYALSEFIEGSDYDVANSEQLRASGEMLGHLHQQLLQFQPEMQLTGPPLETEIFYTIAGAFIPPPTCCGERSHRHRPKLIHGFRRLMFSKVQLVHYTILDTNRSGLYMAIIVLKISSLMAAIFVQSWIWIQLVLRLVYMIWVTRWSFSPPFIKISL